MKPETQIDQTDADLEPAEPGEGASAQAQVRGKGDFGAVGILIIVVAMAGSTLWMIRDVWTDRPVAPGVADIDGSVATHSTESADPDTQAAGRSTAPVAAAAEDAHAVERQSELEAMRQQKEERLLEIKQEAIRVERERLEAEQQLEAERAARAELERERLAAEQRLEAERQARLALEAQRREAEQKLARERAAREALEQQAKLEQEKLMRARQEAELVARERAQADAQRQAAEASAAVDAQPDAAEEPVAAESGVAAQNQPAAEPTALPVPETSSGSLSDPAVAAELADPDAKKFSSNPCAGPSARFLSTCR
ncbi:MAG: hypothetical protein J5I92_14000 [Thiogranum sp.]|nr:hypothetical protein [Thiogranum sp.]